MLAMLKSVLPRPNAITRWLLMGRADGVKSFARAPQLDDEADSDSASEMGDRMSEDDGEGSLREGAS